MGWRVWLDRIGGQNALTIWSWILTLPLGLVIGLSSLVGASIAQMLQWAAVILAVHVVLGAFMWLATVLLLPHRPRASRPITAIAVFFTLGILRALLLTAIEPYLGIASSSLQTRLMTNALGGVIALALIAVFVDDFRTDVAIRERIESARAALERLRQSESETLRAADLDVLQDLHAVLESELQQNEGSPQRIREISEAIVRPMSHLLADDDVVTVPSTVSERRRIGAAVTGLLTSMQMPPALAMTGLVELLAFGSAVAGWGWGVGVANLVIGGGMLALGCWVLDRYVPLPRGVIARPLVILVLLVLLGAGATAGVTAFINAFIGPFRNIVPVGTSLIVVVGILASLWVAAMKERQQRQLALMSATAEEAAEVARLHSEIRKRRAAASDFLHGPIQSQLVASALKGESNEDVIAVLAERFAEYGTTPLDKTARSEFDASLAAWAGVLEISFSASDAAWEVLENDLLRRRLILDALSEAFTNSLRHGSSREIRVNIDATRDRIHLTVSSIGVLRSTGGGGTGLARLRDRGAEVRLHDEPDRVVLTVEA